MKWASLIGHSRTAESRCRPPTCWWAGRGWSSGTTRNSPLKWADRRLPGDARRARMRRKPACRGLSAVRRPHRPGKQNQPDRLRRESPLARNRLVGAILLALVANAAHASEAGRRPDAPPQGAGAVAGTFADSITIEGVSPTKSAMKMTCPSGIRRLLRKATRMPSSRWKPSTSARCTST